MEGLVLIVAVLNNDFWEVWRYTWDQTGEAAIMYEWHNANDMLVLQRDWNGGVSEKRGHD